jgi:hypothetical protein
MMLDDFVDIQIRDQQAVEDVQPARDPIEPILQPAPHGRKAELQPLLEQCLEPEHLRAAVEADDVQVHAHAALEICRREQVTHQRVDVVRPERGVSTRRVGLSWSDSSRRSSIIGSFFARICVRDLLEHARPDVWYGSSVITMSPFSSS